MLKYTCVNCNVELAVEKNDVPLIHFLNNDRKQGIDVIRMGDIWCCPMCNRRVMLGLGNQMNGNGIIGCEDFLKAHPNFVEVKR
jgi:hypothetical protein